MPAPVISWGTQWSKMKGCSRNGTLHRYCEHRTLGGGDSCMLPAVCKRRCRGHGLLLPRVHCLHVCFCGTLQMLFESKEECGGATQMQKGRWGKSSLAESPSTQSKGGTALYRTSPGSRSREGARAAQDCFLRKRPCHSTPIKVHAPPRRKSTEHLSQLGTKWALGCVHASSDRAAGKKCACPLARP